MTVSVRVNLSTQVYSTVQLFHMGIPEKAGRVFPLFQNPKLKLEKRSRVPPYHSQGLPR
jgi:hypothetical protein